MSTDRYEELLARYRDQLEPPGPEVERTVMAVVRRRRRAASRALWRWLVMPQAVPVRPLLAAAALALVIGASVLGTLVAVRRGAGPEALPAAAGAATLLVRFELAAPNAGRVALAGSFNGWSDSTTLFTRSPETGTWSVTVMLPPGEYEYLFVIDGKRWIPDPDAQAFVDDGFGNRNSLIVVGPRGVVRS